MASPAPPAPARLPAARVDPNVLLWLLVALSALMLYPPHEVWDTIRHLSVPDTDDAMRLVEVRGLLDGRAWFDMVEPRFQPPGGVASHWSRLVDALIAAPILVLTPVLGCALAEGVTAALYPPLLLAVFCVVLHRGVRAQFGARAAILAVLAATQTLGLTVQFQVGRVDHHNLQLIVVLGLTLGLIRGGARGGCAAGALAAASLAIGLEGLPYVALAGVFLAGDWTLRGRPADAALAGFGIALGLVAAGLFALQTAPALWTVTACDQLSPPWLFLAAGGMGLGIACRVGRQRLRTIPARLALVGLAGAVLLAGFATLFPACLGGPFPGMTALVREHWLLTVNEMGSVATFAARHRWEAVVYYAVVITAAPTAAWYAWRGPPQGRRAFGVACLFLWPGLLLGLSQFRGLYLASGLVPFVAGPVLDRALTLAGQRTPPLWARLGVGALAVSLLSTLWLAPAILANELDPAARSAEEAQGGSVCQAPASVAPLAALPPGTVLAPVFMGPSILLRTPHAVVAAPYHRAIPGLTAAIEGFGGSEADLRRQVDAFRVDYLVACPARPGADLGGETAFATRLVRGEATADWLERVFLPTGLRVWRVRRPT